MAPVPVVWFVRKFKIIKMESDIPVVSSTCYYLILLNELFANISVTSIGGICCQLLSLLNFLVSRTNFQAKFLSLLTGLQKQFHIFTNFALLKTVC
jgi:hypothetical protein